MKRAILAFITGAVVWVLVASMLDRALRFTLPGYAVAEPRMATALACLARIRATSRP